MSAMISESFGERLRYMRKNKCITQEKFALELGRLGGRVVNKSSVSQYEHNKRTPDAKSLVAIADYFNVTTDYLICGSKCSEKENLLITNFRTLDTEKKNMVIAYSEALCDCGKNQKEKI